MNDIQKFTSVGLISANHSKRKVAKTKIRAWIKRVAKSELRCFDKFIHTLGRWWQEIINYFVNRDNSGFVEGLNNKLKQSALTGMGTKCGLSQQAEHYSQPFQCGMQPCLAASIFPFSLFCLP